MHETCNFKLPKIYLAIMWFSGYDAGANIKISHAGHANFMPGMPNQTSKNWEWIINPARDLGPKFS